MWNTTTPGIEPDWLWIKYKKLVGGGVIKIVNNTCRRRSSKLGYTPGQAADCQPHRFTGPSKARRTWKPEHLAVFDCSFRAERRALHPLHGARADDGGGAAVHFRLDFETINMPDDPRWKTS